MPALAHGGGGDGVIRSSALRRPPLYQGVGVTHLSCRKGLEVAPPPHRHLQASAVRERSDLSSVRDRISVRPRHGRPTKYLPGTSVSLDPEQHIIARAPTGAAGGRAGRTVLLMGVGPTFPGPLRSRRRSQPPAGSLIPRDPAAGPRQLAAPERNAGNTPVPSRFRAAGKPPTRHRADSPSGGRNIGRRRPSPRGRRRRFCRRQESDWNSGVSGTRS